MNNFVHLHTHSHYSLLDGLSKISELVKHAKELGMPAVALTDHGALYGAIEFYKEAKKQGIKPIIGCEVYVAARSRHQKEPRIDNRRYHLTLLAKDNTGYQNLIKLITKAHLEGFYYKPRVDKELLREHAEGLIALSGCPAGELGRAIQAGDKDKAEAVIRSHQEIFGEENYYLEIMHHPEMEFFPQWKNTLVELSRKLNIPLVATQDSHYLYPEDAEAHKVLVAVSTQTDAADTAIFSGNGEYHFISTEEALERFKDIPEAVANTEKIASECNIELSLGKFIFPNFPLEHGETPDGALRELAYRGLKTRGLEGQKDAVERLEYELGIIKFKGYAPYFLVVEDLIRFAAQKNIYTNVRGSVAGSITTYFLGITKLNPLEYKIPFERFLNPDRPSAPDIDMDFADNRRGEVIEYAKQKYGADKVAQIGTFGTMMARGAVRDVARAMGKPYETGNRIATLIPLGSQGFPMTIARALEIEPELKDMYQNDPEAKAILDIAKKLEGTARHVSVHAAGVVISPTPLTEYVPIQYDPKGTDNLITQYDMYSIADEYGGIGLTKLDFLGIRNLTILENAVRLVKERHNVNIDIETIPLDDEKTFKMLARGETEGLFQLNGEGMTRYLIDLKPTTIHDINTMVALYRPGPIQFIPEYIRRKHNPELITYFDPALENILKQTYGILVYQDDLLIMAHDLAGYSWGEADKLRKAVGKKIPAEMVRQKEKFLKGCTGHSGWSQKKAEEVWAWIEPFAAYGFNKAHAASYGRVAYQTAYMKANFPVEYMCAVLAAEAGDIEKVAGMISECRRMNIAVLPPDVNESGTVFSVVGPKAIRFGLAAIKNVGGSIAEALVKERVRGGEYKNIEDFLSRLDVKDLNKKSLQSLLKAGVFDSLGERGVLLANLEPLLAFAKESRNAKTHGQSSIFEAAGAGSPTIRLRPVEAASKRDKLAWEKELLGLYVSDHPLAHIKPILEKRAKQIRALSPNRGRVHVGGILTKLRKILTRNGASMVFAQLEDLTGKIEVVVFPSALEKNVPIWQEDNIVLVTGRVQKRDNDLKIICEEAQLLES